jgi:hypothetical protein
MGDDHIMMVQRREAIVDPMAVKQSEDISCVNCLHYVYIAIRPILKLITNTAIYQNQLMTAISNNDVLTVKKCYYGSMSSG